MCGAMFMANSLKMLVQKRAFSNVRRIEFNRILHKTSIVCKRRVLVPVEHKRTRISSVISLGLFYLIVIK